MSKSRLTVAVDDAALGAAREAVRSGAAPSLSSWVNAALIEKASRDRRIAALRAAIAEYEAEQGEITEEEVAAQRRADHANAIVACGRKTQTGST